MSDSLRERAEERADAKIKFYINFTSYVIVNGLLAIINVLFTPECWWVIFPMFFWGIGIVIGFLKTFVFVDVFDSEEYRQRKIQEEMERLRV